MKKSMKSLISLFVSGLSLIFLFSCGGGGGGDDNNSIIISSPAEGLYTGTTSTGRQATGLVLDDGTIYILYSVIGSPNFIGGIVQGNSEAHNEVLSSTNAKDFNLEGSGVLSATITGAYNPTASISGLVSYPALNETVAFDMAYDPAYELSPSVEFISGNYSGEVVTSVGWEYANLSISSTGVISGSGDSGCTVTGTVQERDSGNVYNFGITFGPSPCLFANQTFTGIAYFDATDNWLYAAAPNASRSDGILFSGGKF